MKQTKSKYTESEKWMMTAEHIGSKIPYCIDLKDYKIDWMMNKDDPEIIPLIQRRIRRRVCQWIVNTPEDEVAYAARQLNPAARIHLCQILPLRFHGFFEFPGGQFPKFLALPAVFFSIEKKRRGENMILDNLTKRAFDREVVIKGPMCTGEHLKLVIALNQIRKRTLGNVEMDGKLRMIRYRMDYTELAEELDIPNPTHNRTHQYLQAMLEQLRAMTIVWTKTGRKLASYIGGFIHVASILEEDSAYEIEIVQDTIFLHLMEKQFIGIPEKDLKTFYHLPGKSVLLYMFLSTYESFNRFGYFNSKQYHMTIFDIYEYSGMQNPFTINDKATIRKLLKAELENLVKQKLISKYSIDGDVLLIGERQKLSENIKETKKGSGMIRQQKELKCPYGHRFRDDCDKYDECMNCKLWDKCNI